MRIPKIKVNKASVDDILRPLGALIEVAAQIGGKEMIDDFTEATKRKIDEYHDFLLKKKAEQEAAK